MARAFDTDVVIDRAGNVWQNVLGTLYTDAAHTTLVSDAYAAAAGGSPITTVTTDSAGRYSVYFTTPKSYWIRWSSNGGTAYPAGSPTSTAPFTTFTSAEHQAFEKASDVVLEAGALNLLDYGAKIDSSGATGNGTDDRAAWVLALADMAATGRPLLVPHGVTGISRCSTGISISAASNYVIVGEGGKNGTFGFGGQGEVSFDTGGLAFTYGVSGSLRIHNMYIIGTDTAGLWMNNAANLSLHNTTCRGYGTNAPGLKSTDNFFIYADPDCSFQSSDTGTPCILIEETSGTGGGEAWDYYIKGCRLNIGNIKLTVGVTGASVVGEQIVIEDVVCENFAASTPILDVVWTAPYNLHEITMNRCNVADSTTPFGIRFTNNSGSTCGVTNLLVTQTMAGCTNIVQTAGANAVSFSSALLLGQGQKIKASTNTPTPTYVTLDNTDAMWRMYSNIAAAIQISGRIETDTYDRSNYRMDGLSLGPGTSALDVDVSRSAARSVRFKALVAGLASFILDNSDASSDTQLSFYVNGSDKGDIYAEHTSGELRIYKGGDLIRIDTGKLGFLGAAPVVRQTLGGAATDPATTQTLANNLRTALINLGLGQT